MLLTLARGLVSLGIDHNNILLPKLPGHNNDPFTEAMAGFGINDYSRHIMQKVHDCRIPLVFVGHSLTALCAKELGDSRPNAVGSIMIDPPGLGGLNFETTWRILRNPSYVGALWSEKPFIIERSDAIDLLFNGEMHPQVESIIRQPASGLAVKQAIRAKVKKGVRPSAVIAAGASRLYPLKAKRKWCEKTNNPFVVFEGASHSGILDCPDLAACVIDHTKHFIRNM